MAGVPLEPLGLGNKRQAQQASRARRPKWETAVILLGNIYGGAARSWRVLTPIAAFRAAGARKKE